MRRSFSRIRFGFKAFCKTLNDVADENLPDVLLYFGVIIHARRPGILSYPQIVDARSFAGHAGKRGKT